MKRDHIGQCMAALLNNGQEGRAVAGNYRAMQGICIKSLYLILGQRMNRKNTKTIRKHREVVAKTTLQMYQ